MIIFLAHPNYEQPFIIQTDACYTGLDGVLLKKYSGVLFNSSAEFYNQH